MLLEWLLCSNFVRITLFQLYFLGMFMLHTRGCICLVEQLCLPYCSATAVKIKVPDLSHSLLFVYVQLAVSHAECELAQSATITLTMQASYCFLCKHTPAVPIYRQLCAHIKPIKGTQQLLLELRKVFMKPKELQFIL